MTNDKPPVAPKEGFYAMLRNGMVVRPKMDDDSRKPFFYDADLDWYADGRAMVDPLDEVRANCASDFDIIATISPEAMALAIHPDMDGAVKAIENLVKLADAACDYADSHCRWFDISTAPKDGTLIQMVVANGDFPTDDNDELGHITIGSWQEEADESNEPDWDFVGWHWAHDFWTRGNGLPTHWRPLPPPPTNPPLPAVFVELGAALEKIKGAG